MYPPCILHAFYRSSLQATFELLGDLTRWVTNPQLIGAGLSASGLVYKA